MYSRSVSSFCVELSSCRVGGCRVGPPPRYRLLMNSQVFILDTLSVLNTFYTLCYTLFHFLRKI